MSLPKSHQSTELAQEVKGEGMQIERGKPTLWQDSREIEVSHPTQFPPRLPPATHTHTHTLRFRPAK
jgi:hypothetical protein